MHSVGVNFENISLLRSFISKLGSSSRTFRYFESRDLESCLLNHKKTILLIDGDEPIGYGHLDKDPSDKKTWLGIALREQSCGKGLGKKIMEKLLENCSEDIYLSVDSLNVAGQKLYSKFGFEIIKCKSNIIYMIKRHV